MALFWIKSESHGRPVFRLRHDTAQVFAMIRWAIAHSAAEEYVTSGQIAPELVHRVPKRMVGRELSQSDVEALIARLERAAARAVNTPSR